MAKGNGIRIGTWVNIASSKLSSIVWWCKMRIRNNYDTKRWWWRDNAMKIVRWAIRQWHDGKRRLCEGAMSMTGCFNDENAMLYRAIVRSFSLYLPIFIEPLRYSLYCTSAFEKKLVALCSELMNGLYVRNKTHSVNYCKIVFFLFLHVK